MAQWGSELVRSENISPEAAGFTTRAAILFYPTPSNPEGNTDMYTKIDIAAGGANVQEMDLPLSSRRCSDGNGTLSYLFFSDEWVDIQRAKAICGKCSDARDCLQGALDREEPWGVWGGEELEMGRVVSVRRPRGRPPVKSASVTAIEEVPIPRHLVA